MRTKPLEGVSRFEICRLDVLPEFNLIYDGLAGFSARPMLRDFMDELERRGPEKVREVLEALRRIGRAKLWVHFNDYVSYGIGGGDAASEFFLATYQLLYMPARPAGKAPAVPEHLALFRPGGIERLALA